MICQAGKAWCILTATLTTLSTATLAVVAQAGPPSEGSTVRTERQPISLDTAVLDRYAGSYKLNDNVVLAVTRRGGQLFAQLTGQPPEPIYPSTPTEFFYKVVDAQISFVVSPQGQVSSLVLHQNGHNIAMARIEESMAHQITANTQAKVQSQTPSPASEAALRGLIASLVAGRPDYDRMSPAVAQAIRQQLPRLQSDLSTLGPVQAVTFLGVDGQGQDHFDVKQQNGFTHWTIAVGPDGIIQGALFRPGP